MSKIHIPLVFFWNFSGNLEYLKECPLTCINVRPDMLVHEFLMFQGYFLVMGIGYLSLLFVGVIRDLCPSFCMDKNILSNGKNNNLFMYKKFSTQTKIFCPIQKDAALGLGLCMLQWQKSSYWVLYGQITL